VVVDGERREGSLHCVKHAILDFAVLSKGRAILVNLYPGAGRANSPGSPDSRYVFDPASSPFATILSIIASPAGCSSPRYAASEGSGALGKLEYGFARSGGQRPVHQHLPPACVSARGLDADRRRDHRSQTNKIKTLDSRARPFRGAKFDQHSQMAAIGKALARVLSTDEGTNTTLLLVVLCLVGLVASLLVAKYGADLSVVWPEAEF
jgi:hypothetical protein